MTAHAFQLPSNPCCRHEVYILVFDMCSYYCNAMQCNAGYQLRTVICKYLMIDVDEKYAAPSRTRCRIQIDTNCSLPKCASSQNCYIIIISFFVKLYGLSLVHCVQSAPISTRLRKAIIRTVDQDPYTWRVQSWLRENVSVSQLNICLIRFEQLNVWSTGLVQLRYRKVHLHPGNAVAITVSLHSCTWH